MSVRSPFHRNAYRESGAELIMGSGRFVARRTIEVALNDGGTRLLSGDEVVVNVGSHAAIPDVPGLDAAGALTHIEALELDYLPAHLIVLGGGYTGIEMAQAYRRFGSRVTIIEPGRQLMSREDADVARDMQEILASEGVEVLLDAQPLGVHGLSGDAVAVTVHASGPERTIEGSDLLVATGRIANTADIGASRPASRWMRGLYPRRRAAADEFRRCLGDRRVCRQPAVHACLGRRFQDRQGQHGWRQAKD